MNCKHKSIRWTNRKITYLYVSWNIIVRYIGQEHFRSVFIEWNKTESLGSSFSSYFLYLKVLHTTQIYKIIRKASSEADNFMKMLFTTYPRKRFSSSKNSHDSGGGRPLAGTIQNQSSKFYVLHTVIFNSLQNVHVCLDAGKQFGWFCYFAGIQVEHNHANECSSESTLQVLIEVFTRCECVLPNRDRRAII